MMHAPTHHEILLAEQRLIQSRRELAAGTVRLRTAFRATLAKPTTLLAAAGAGAIAGYLLFKRPAQVEVARNWLSRWPALSARWEELRAHLPSIGGPSTEATATTAAGATSLAGLVLAFASRYAMQQLPRIGLQMVEQALRKQRAAATPSYPSGASLH